MQTLPLTGSDVNHWSPICGASYVTDVVDREKTFQAKALTIYARWWNNPAYYHGKALSWGGIIESCNVPTFRMSLDELVTYYLANREQETLDLPEPEILRGLHYLSPFVKDWLAQNGNGFVDPPEVEYHPWFWYDAVEFGENDVVAFKMYGMLGDEEPLPTTAAMFIPYVQAMIVRVMLQTHLMEQIKGLATFGLRGGRPTG